MDSRFVTLFLLIQPALVNLAALSSTHIPVSLTFSPDKPFRPGMNVTICGEFLLSRDQLLFASLTKVVSKTWSSTLSQEVWDVYKDGATVLSSPGHKYKNRILHHQLRFADAPGRPSSLCVMFPVNYCDSGEYKLSVERDPPPAPSDVKQVMYIEASIEMVFDDKILDPTREAHLYYDAGASLEVTCKSRGTSPEVTLSVVAVDEGRHQVSLYQISSDSQYQTDSCAVTASQTQQITFTAQGKYKVICCVKNEDKITIADVYVQIQDVGKVGAVQGSSSMLSFKGVGMFLLGTLVGLLLAGTVAILYVIIRRVKRKKRRRKCTEVGKGDETEMLYRMQLKEQSLLQDEREQNALMHEKLMQQNENNQLQQQSMRIPQKELQNGSLRTKQIERQQQLQQTMSPTESEEEDDTDRHNPQFWGLSKWIWGSNNAR